MTNTSVAPARGRKRFLFDLKRASQTVAQGVEVQGLRMLSVAGGEEDGSFDCAIAHSNGELIAALTFLVSDASEYPSDHTFFCSSQDELPPYVSRVTESIHEDGSLSIQELLMRLLEKLAKRAPGTTQIVTRDDPNSENSENEEDDDDDDMDDYDMDEDLGILGGVPSISKVDRSMLQGHFNEIVAYGYCPGFIPLGADDFALSVSIPIKSLADTIPARALMAWDKRLLARGQYFTLLISGLRGVYPFVQEDGTYNQSAHFHGAVSQFRVGLTLGYKPTREDATDVIRKYGLKEEYQAESVPEIIPEPLFGDDDDFWEPEEGQNETEPEEPEPEEQIAGFRPFSLSSSLESLLDSHFLRILQLRIQYDLGWAGAETLWWEVETSQQPPGDIMRLRGTAIRQADVEDDQLSKSYFLPADSLMDRNPQEAINLPLVAFSYLLRRLTLCPRYCLVCHQQLKEDLDALKPYVCSSKLCTYQYYNLNRGPSLEYEICANTVTVDLLVSLAYIAAAEGALDAPLPIGMGLLVPARGNTAGPSEDFDQLPIGEMRSAIMRLIDMIPPIADIKRHLEQPLKPGRAKPRLQNMDKSIPEAAWSVLRWCVASCTAHLEELQSDEEKVQNIGSDWRQFRFSVGAPDAEAKFRQAAQSENAVAKQYPSLYAFHGSPAKNWHSIIRHGLWFKTITHGRAYGHGVYFAKDGSVSTSSYAVGAQTCWRNSAARLTSCVALAEIINLPEKFVSSNPYFVVSQTEWIICRYLMIRSGSSAMYNGWGSHPTPPVETPVDDRIPYVPLDPSHPLTLSGKNIRIPEPTHALEKILTARREEYMPVDYDEEDLQIFLAQPPAPPASNGEDQVEEEPLADVDDWVHDRDWVQRSMDHILPPPTESAIQATTALQRELKAMLKEQQMAKSLKELGWYMPEDLIGDNLYQWIVELHSFDKDLPIAQDMESHGVNSLVFEIRFPAAFPHAPPFFRILKPRFLPFSQGGGGHVTLGGSMCMDLLTADGWLPSYSISAILLQIKLAISNLDPKPARLASNWETPYGMQEALEGYKRAAHTHGWKIPKNMDRIAQ